PPSYGRPRRIKGAGRLPVVPFQPRRPPPPPWPEGRSRGRVPASAGSRHQPCRPSVPRTPPERITRSVKTSPTPLEAAGRRGWPLIVSGTSNRAYPTHVRALGMVLDVMAFLLLILEAVGERRASRWKDDLEGADDYIEGGHRRAI